MRRTLWRRSHASHLGFFSSPAFSWAARAVVFTGLFFASLAMSASSHAAFLPPGGTLYPAPGGPLPGGAIAAGTGIPVPFASGLYSGKLTSTVLVGDPTNPFVGVGGLTFTYALTSDPTSIDSLERLTVNNFAPFLTDADYVLGPGLAPALIDRSVAGTVGFSFIQAPIGPGKLAPGAATTLIVVYTNATLFAPTFANVIDGAVTSVTSFAPGVAVPEPATLLLTMIGVVPLGISLRFRRSRI